MTDPDVLKHLDNIYDKVLETLSEEESYEDFSKLCEIIVFSRLNLTDRDEVTGLDVDIAAKSLCVFFPMKPPKYVQDVKRMRKDYIGIDDNESLQEQFGEILSKQLLLVREISQLDFSDINNIFVQRNAYAYA